MIHLGLQIDFNSDRWPVTAQNWTVPLCRGEAGRGRWQSCLDLLDLMLTVQMGQNYRVGLLNMWLGTEGSSPYAGVGYLHWMAKKQPPTKIQKSPLSMKQCLLTDLSRFDPESLSPSDFHCGVSLILVLGTTPHPWLYQMLHRLVV